MFKLRVKSRNHSCAPLRNIRTPFRVLYRMGKPVSLEEVFPNPRIRATRRIMEINSAKGCIISADKIKMKKAFDLARVQHAEWFYIRPNDDARTKVLEHLTQWNKIIVKHKHSSKGRGIYLLESIEDFDNFKEGKNLSNYVFERYYTYSKEYRIHVNKFGYFYTCRKMLRHDAEDRWHRHSSNSVFILEENPDFNRPANWDDIVRDCIKAMKVIGLDIAAFDVKVNVDGTKFILLESNSAPSLGEDGIERYTYALKQLIYE